jgi:hypothetical protein
LHIVGRGTNRTVRKPSTGQTNSVASDVNVLLLLSEIRDLNGGC